jgi:hypothetical protein
VLAARAVPGAPWYRQFWPWFLIGILAASVATGVAVLVVAIRNADSVVRDDWYKRGLAINVDLERERAAAALGLEAALTITGDGHALELVLSGRGAGTDTALDLELAHPTHADRDTTLRLVRGADGVFRATAPDALAGRWYASLMPPDRGWRLVGELRLGAPVAVRLAPRT